MQGEEDALRTVECLRGRLLAERSASKAAKDTADLLTTKLKELEEKVKIEEKCRRKAEKKLGILKNKLESLKIIEGLSVSEESDESISNSTDQISEIRSCVSISSSIASSSTTGFRSSSSDPGDVNIVQPRSSTSYAQDHNADQGERIQSEIEVEKDHRTENHCVLKASAAMEEKRGKEERETEEEEEEEKVEVDNSMALVPLSLSTESKNKTLNQEMKVDSESVREVLHTLKQIKQNLQTAMQRRRIIKVG